MSPFDDFSETPPAGSDTGVNPEEGNSSSAQGSGNSDFTIPDEYKEKGWTRFFAGKSGDELKAELFKSYDNQQSLIGKKVSDYLANTDLSTLENFEDIKKALAAQIAPQYNVPEDVKDYNLNSIIKNESGENLYPIADEAIESFSGIFKELGLTTEQAQGLLKSYIDYEVAEFQKYTDADELEQSINQMFSGNQEQRRTCESLIKEFLSPQDQKLVQDTMPNAVIEMFYKISKGLVDKYGYKEGNTPPQQHSLKMTEAEKETEYNRLVSELEALKRRPHSDADEQKLINQIAELWK